MLEEKTIQFANFNITFGENEEAMLMHFEDMGLSRILCKRSPRV